jgi:hypothetical protein
MLGHAAGELDVAVVEVIGRLSNGAVGSGWLF